MIIANESRLSILETYKQSVSMGDSFGMSVNAITSSAMNRSSTEIITVTVTANDSNDNTVLETLPSMFNNYMHLVLKFE